MPDPAVPGLDHHVQYADPVHRLRLPGTIVAAGRQGIFLIPALLTLPRFLGILGLQLCQPIADVCTSVMAAVIVVSILKELKVWNEEIQNLSKKTMDE